MGVALDSATIRDLWAHARTLGERAERESDLAALRRALVTVAVAGSGDDVAGFGELVGALAVCARRLGIDPEPLFDAAAALVAEPDVAAREALVLAPRRIAGHPPGAGTPWGVLRPRDG